MGEKAGLDNPILNSPYEPPAAHFELGPNGPTGELATGRRPSESFVALAPGRRRRGTTQDAHAYFTGGQDPYKRLRQALKADIDEEAWASLNRTESRPFPKPSTGKLAVKVLNDYGDEVIKVVEV